MAQRVLSSKKKTRLTTLNIKQPGKSILIKWNKMLYLTLKK